MELWVLFVSFITQCRRRWKNYLNADLKKGGWSLEVSEDDGLHGGMIWTPRLIHVTLLNIFRKTKYYWKATAGMETSGRRLPRWSVDALITQSR